MLDHLVISCEKLDDGQAWAEQRLGVAFEPGGKHELFGTHNVLLGLADGLYIEVIAPDPDAPPPQMRRWYALDRFRGAPRLTHWACRTSNLTAALEAAPEAGRATQLARGDFRWLMAVTLTGMLPYDGMFPAILEWQGAHPSDRLDDKGCRLKSLTINHPRAMMLLKRLGNSFDNSKVRIGIGAVGISAEIDTPNGLVKL